MINNINDSYFCANKINQEKKNESSSLPSFHSTFFNRSVFFELCAGEEKKYNDISDSYKILKCILAEKKGLATLKEIAVHKVPASLSSPAFRLPCKANNRFVFKHSGHAEVDPKYIDAWLSQAAKHAKSNSQGLNQQAVEDKQVYGVFVKDDSETGDKQLERYKWLPPKRTD